MKRTKIDVELIKEHFEYNSETGDIVWIKPTSFRVSCGDIAGSIGDTGYRSIIFKKKKYKAHRLAWVLHYGEDPGNYEIDHIDRNKSNNAISNLRLATRAENGGNMLGRGITKMRNKWRAMIEHRGIKQHIGVYECPLLAHVAYVDKARELRGEFAAV